MKKNKIYIITSIRLNKELAQQVKQVQEQLDDVNFSDTIRLLLREALYARANATELAEDLV